MSLDSKITYITSRKTEILDKLLVRYNKNLSLRGNQDVTLGIYIDILIYCLTLTSLGDVTRLELYKKVIEVLRKNNLLGRMQDPSPVFPYYYGVGVQSLSVASIQLLSVELTDKENKSYDYSPTMEVYYIAYPAIYGILTSILDTNEFETIDGWTLRVEDFTVDSVIVSYNIYEFNNITTQINFTNTFKY